MKKYMLISFGQSLFLFGMLISSISSRKWDELLLFTSLLIINFAMGMGLCRDMQNKTSTNEHIAETSRSRHQTIKSKERKKSDGQILLVIENAIRSNSKVEITYESASGDWTDRTISPERYDDYENVFSYCHLRGVHRNFKVDRILTAFPV